MDYEKKYKEALNWMKDVYPTLEGAAKKDAEHYFPELKESEDERIRKSIQRLISHYYDVNFPTPEGFTREDLMSWLEKQGEKEKFIKKELECISGYRDEAIKRLNELEKQGEHKPAWSEEDEKTINNICHIIRQYDKISKKENQPCWYIGDCLLWMQNIKNKVIPQPRQEWSEENKKIIDNLISQLGNLCSRKLIKEETKDKYVNWLKSLRPQSQWKPSDEQLAALLTAIGDEKKTGSEVAKVLRELYYELKKLREE